MEISNLSSSAKLMRRTRTAVEPCLWLTLLWGQQKIYFTELLLLMVSTKEKNLLKVHLQWHSLNFHACFLFFFPVDDIPELLSSSSLFSMLLPLILAYIGPVAASVPKVESAPTLSLNLLTYLFPVWNSNAMPPPLPSGCSRSLCTGSGSVTSCLCSQPKICPTHLQSQSVNWQHDWQPAWAGPLSLYHLQPLFSNRKWPSLQTGQCNAVQGKLLVGLYSVSYVRHQVEAQIFSGFSFFNLLLPFYRYHFQTVSAGPQ